MSQQPRFDIYCDESSHLPHSEGNYMVLGALRCAHVSTRDVAAGLRSIKARHGVDPHMEVKWTKVSPGKVGLYLDLVQYFFSHDSLTFRAVIADRTRLKHRAFGQTHDEWYYKMYYTLLRPLLVPPARYRVFLDIKDTQGAHKVRKLHDVLCNALRDFERDIVELVQQVRSDEVEQLQLADLMIGAVAAANRQETRSPAKLEVIRAVQQMSNLTLRHTTALESLKLNVLRWQPKSGAPTPPEPAR